MLAGMKSRPLREIDQVEVLDIDETGFSEMPIATRAGHALLKEHLFLNGSLRRTIYRCVRCGHCNWHKHAMISHASTMHGALGVAGTSEVHHLYMQATMPVIPIQEGNTSADAFASDLSDVHNVLDGVHGIFDSVHDDPQSMLDTDDSVQDLGDTVSVEGATKHPLARRPVAQVRLMLIAFV
jgi:hypothetical protein